jgi:glucan-binding YG repeat protein
MTSFAAGWEKDEAGIWHYYDSDDDMVTGEWKKDGGKWFYLDDDGDMLTDAWVDDEYYVGSDGAMYTNQWYKGFGDDDEQDDPEDSGEHWYYFGSKGKKVNGDKKKIGGKTYYFDDDGHMRYGWYQDGDAVYYLGGEDEGWRAESQWLWLEKSSVAAEADDDDYMEVLGCTEDDDCDDEGWYWFQSSGKMYYGTKKKKVNGNFFVFNDHGQMLYEWINGAKVKAGTPSGAHYELDGIATAESATIGQMLYYRENGSDSIDGSRPTGWFQIDGSEDVGTDSDTKWYYIKKGEAKHASGADFAGIRDGSNKVYVKREKIDGKWFAFDEKGQMVDGLQFIGSVDDAGRASASVYYFNSDGYQQTGKQSNVEEGDDDTFNYYFNSKNSGNGKGYTGEKDGYLYWNGKRLEADDDYKIYVVNGSYYLVNTKGKLQKSTSKKYDIEVPNGTVEEVQFPSKTTDWENNKGYKLAADAKVGDSTVANMAAVPYIIIKDSVILEDPSNFTTTTVVWEGMDSRPDFFGVADAKELAGSTAEADEDDEE